LGADKQYEAGIELGVVTTTSDAEGEVLERNPVSVSEDRIEAALGAFRGEIEQVPPMHSALKRGGEPLYRLARRGLEVERPARRVTIRSLEMLRFRGTRLDIRMTCTSGTYVRSLAEDLGELLGCGAHLAALRRTRIGALDVGRSVTLQRLEEVDIGRRDEILLPCDALVATLPAVNLDASDAARFRQGQTVSCGLSAGLWRVYCESGFLGVGCGQPNGGVAPQRVVAI
jgi:tRNA pseudouridine55 synthase